MFRPHNRTKTYCSRKCYLQAPRKGTVQTTGYVMIYAPEQSQNKSGQMLEHRYVMEKKLGRRLRADETVHHIDGDKTNNRPENLQLRQGLHGKHVAMQCLNCGSANIGAVPLAESERDKEARRKLNDEPPTLL